MRSPFYTVLATGALICACSSIGANAMQNDGQEAKSDNVTFYKVPLMCHAAPGIGCGSLSKPVLLDLESKPIVKEAWLDRQGNTLAIVWKEGTGAAARTIVVMSAMIGRNNSAFGEIVGALAITRSTRRSRQRPNCCDRSWRTSFASAWWDRRTRSPRDAARHSQLI